MKKGKLKRNELERNELEKIQKDLDSLEKRVKQLECNHSAFDYIRFENLTRKVCTWCGKDLGFVAIKEIEG